MDDIKKRERAARRAAKSLDMLVCKSRIQNPEHLAYDGYMLIDAQHNHVVSGADSYDYSLSLGDLEAELEDFLSLNAGGCEPRKLAA